MHHCAVQTADRLHVTVPGRQWQAIQQPGHDHVPAWRRCGRRPRVRVLASSWALCRCSIVQVLCTRPLCGKTKPRSNLDNQPSCQLSFRTWQQSVARLVVGSVQALCTNPLCSKTRPDSDQTWARSILKPAVISDWTGQSVV